MHQMQIYDKFSHKKILKLELASIAFFTHSIVFPFHMTSLTRWNLLAMVFLNVSESFIKIFISQAKSNR